MADLPVAEDFISSSTTEAAFKAALKILVENVASKDWVNANPSFKTIKLTTETITSIIQSGNYLQDTFANATVARGYPEQDTGRLVVVGVGNYVFYTYKTRTTNNVYEASLVGGVLSPWVLVSSANFFAFKGALGSTNLDTSLAQGWWLQNNSTLIDDTMNYPMKKPGRLDVHAVGSSSLRFYTYTTIDNDVCFKAFNGTTWTPWSITANKLTTDANIATALTQAKAYTDIGATSLFKKDITPVLTNNLLVRRYLTTGAITNYPAGTYQTIDGSALKNTVTPSGSSAIAHYFQTGFSGFTSVSASFTIKTINMVASGEGVGIGFIDSSDNYIAYILTESGNVVKIQNQLNTLVQAGLPTFTANDVIKVSAKGNILKFYKNDLLIFTGTCDLFAGQLIVGQRGFSSYSFSLTLSSDPIREYVVEQVAASGVSTQSPCYYSFNPNGGASAAGLLMAYTQIKDSKYVGFEIVHEVDNSELVYKDYWRIFQAKIYTLTSGSMVDSGVFALGEGESEFVFKQNSTKDDFTGGYHGDEKYTSLTVMIDGVPISLTSNIALTAAKQIEYVEKSTMHATAESGMVISGHPKVADHIKQTIIRNGGYSSFNRITWNIADTVSTMYHGISCIHKNVASAAFTDGSFSEQVMDASGTMYFNELNARAVSYYNSTNGYAAQATASINKPAADDIASTLFVHDRTGDSKYYRKSPAKTVTVGEVWESKFSCQFLKL